MHTLNLAPRLSTSIVDYDSPRELTRQLNKQQMLATIMGGIPEPLDLSGFHDVLDIACGPGGWTLDLAGHHPQMQFTGIDLSRTMIEFARTQAGVRGQHNAHFRVMDATGTLDFPDGSFDLINGSLLSDFLMRHHWGPLLAECMRLLRHGGILRLTEVEPGTSSSQAHNKLMGMFLKAMFLTGRGFSPDGHHLGVILKLRPFLQKAGFQDIQTSSHHMEYSYGSPLHEPWAYDLLTLTDLALPFLVESGAATCQEVWQTSEQVAMQMLSPQFSCRSTHLTAWGSKPPTGTLGYWPPGGSDSRTALQRRSPFKRGVRYSANV